MKIHFFEQNSTEWENIRKGKITASTFKDLISSTTLKVSQSVASKKAIAKIVASGVCDRFGEAENTISKLPWVMNGIDCEARARILYQKSQERIVREVGFIEHDSGLAGFSPDGLVDGGMIEIKTQCQKEHFYCKLFGFDEWLKKYKPQILFSMAINDDIQFCDCISYNEDFNTREDRLIIHRYERDEEEIEKVLFAIDYWITYLKKI